MVSIRRHTAYNLMGAVIPLAVSLVTIPIYLKLIGVERYGTLAILWTLMGYFGFMNLGLGRAIAQRLASTSESTPEERSSMVWTALAMTFSLGLLAGIILWLSADLILVEWIDMSPQNLTEAQRAVPWFVAAMPLILGASVLSGALHGRQHFLAMNVLQITSTSLAQLLPLGVAALGHVELEWLVPAALAAKLMTFAANIEFCRRYLLLQAWPNFDRTHIKPLFSYGGWVSAMSLMAPLLVAIDRLVIGVMAGAKAVAFYTVPYGIVTRPLMLSGSLHSALFPRMADMNERDSVVLVDKASRSLVAVMLLIALAGIPFVHPFLNIWVGREFAEQARGVGEILLMGVLLNSIVYPHHSRLMAVGKVRLITGIYLMELPLYFLMLWFGLSEFGLLGAAAAWSARVLVDSALLLFVSSALKKVLSYSMVPAMLTALSVLVSLALPVDSAMRWAVSLLLLLFGVWLGRHQLQEVVVRIKTRKVVLV